MRCYSENDRIGKIRVSITVRVGGGETRQGAALEEVTENADGVGNVHRSAPVDIAPRGTDGARLSERRFRRSPRTSARAPRPGDVSLELGVVDGIDDRRSAGGTAAHQDQATTPRAQLEGRVKRPVFRVVVARDEHDVTWGEDEINWKVEPVPVLRKLLPEG